MRSTQVSAIIVNYNTGKLLTKAVRSVIGIPGIEVIVVDNASRDESIATLEKSVKAKNLKVFKNSDNIGFGKAVNQGVLSARGKYIYLLNPDAELTSKNLNRLVETAGSFKNNCIVAPKLINPDGTPQASCYRKQSIWSAVCEFLLGEKGAYQKYLPLGKSPQVVHAAVAAAWLVPKAVWVMLGGFDEKFFLYFEDLDLCDRAAKLGIKVIYDPQAVVKHHHGVSSKTNPIVMKLFKSSAYKYHGSLKKLTLDGIIILGRLLTFPRSIKKTLLLYIFWASAVLVFSASGFFVLPERYSPLNFINHAWQSNYLFWSRANFDGEHYLSIAKYGYQIVSGFSQYAFFPLFPLLIAISSIVLSDVFLSGILISLVSGIAFLYYFTKWLELKKVSKVQAVILSLLVHPGSIFLHAVYTEPLFLALSAAALYFAEKEKWSRSVVLIALASATRANGVFLSLFLFIRLLEKHAKPLKSAFLSFLSATGLLAYMTYLYFSAGTPFAFANAQSSWGKAAFQSPIETVAEYVRAVTLQFTPDLTHAVVVVEILSLILGTYLIVGVLTKKQLPRSYIVLLLANLLFPLLTGSLGSMPRFILNLFPGLVIFSKWKPRRLILYYSASALIMLFGTILFVRGYWYA